MLAWWTAFRLSNRQKRGLIVLILLLLLVIIVPPIARRYLLKHREPVTIRWQLRAPADTGNSRALRPQPFNPNEVDSATLHRMGLPAPLISQWMAYRRAGGVFRFKDDVLRLYAMDKETYLALVPFIQLDNPFYNRQQESTSGYAMDKEDEVSIPILDINAADTLALRKLPGIGPFYARMIVNHRKKIRGFDSIAQLSAVYGMDSHLVAKVTPYLKVGPKPDYPPPPPPQVYELNTIDSTQWLTFRGIGPVFAGRIVAYREALGGFHSLSQLHEVYGLEAMDLGPLEARLTIDTTKLRKLHLDEASQATLEAHPYISRTLARFIVSYRHRHSEGFTTPSALLESFTMNPKKLEKLRPYLKW